MDSGTVEEAEGASGEAEVAGLDLQVEVMEASEEEEAAAVVSEEEAGQAGAAVEAEVGVAEEGLEEARR